jgi:hypothetical protein
MSAIEFSGQMFPGNRLTFQFTASPGHGTIRGKIICRFERSVPFEFAPDVSALHCALVVNAASRHFKASLLAVPLTEAEERCGFILKTNLVQREIVEPVTTHGSLVKQTLSLGLSFAAGQAVMGSRGMLAKFLNALVDVDHEARGIAARVIAFMNENVRYPHHKLDSNRPSCRRCPDQTFGLGF